MAPKKKVEKKREPQEEGVMPPEPVAAPVEPPPVVRYPKCHTCGRDLPSA